MPKESGMAGSSDRAERGTWGAALSQEVPRDLVRERLAGVAQSPRTPFSLAKLGDAPWGLYKQRQDPARGMRQGLVCSSIFIIKQYLTFSQIL